MKRFAIVCAATFVSFAAQADTYPSTLRENEKERHEFYHVQAESYPALRTGGEVFNEPYRSQAGDTSTTRAPHAPHYSGRHSHSDTRG